MKITKNNWLSIALQKFPDFQSNWNKYLLLWNSDSPGLTLEMIEFADYALQKIKEDSHEAQHIFEFIEQLLSEADSEVQNAAATGFLEAILNAIPKDVKAAKVTKLLGPLSYEYCKAWNKFTGIKIEGF